ncbi:uncharacterized protein PAC_11976 [Phialocephala subalpina]|uniref:Zn(2)-C6 fungal-type domain-containing protein n=1 Tax=Phialocephala subalpina TaxID=576137 RepID=A0A1L7XAN0_9HELO|nr:uncharacterized protein PAC_11976 [Phialocephala subalpina]
MAGSHANMDIIEISDSDDEQANTQANAIMVSDSHEEHTDTNVTNDALQQAVSTPAVNSDAESSEDEDPITLHRRRRRPLAHVSENLAASNDVYQDLHTPSSNGLQSAVAVINHAREPVNPRPAAKRAKGNGKTTAKGTYPEPRSDDESSDKVEQEPVVPRKQARSGHQKSKSSAPDQTHNGQGSESVADDEILNSNERSSPVFEVVTNPTKLAELHAAHSKYSNMMPGQTLSLAKERGYMCLKNKENKKFSTAHHVLSRWLAHFNVVFSDYERELLMKDLTFLQDIAKAAGAKFKRKPGKQEVMEWFIDNPRPLVKDPGQNPPEFQRACERCRRKKDKCSHEKPCSQCKKHNEECVHPEDGRHKLSSTPKLPDAPKLPAAPKLSTASELSSAPKLVSALELLKASKLPEPSQMPDVSEPLVKATSRGKAVRDMARAYSRTTWPASPVLSGQGERLPKTDPKVLAAVSSLQVKYAGLRRMQITALAHHRGFEFFRDADNNLTTEAYTRWLAEFDVIFTEEERELWPMTIAELKNLARNRNSGLVDEQSRIGLIKWLLSHSAAPPNPAQVVANLSTSVDTEAVEYIFWLPPHSNDDLVALAKKTQRKILLGNARAKFKEGPNYWLQGDRRDIRSEVLELGICDSSAEGSRDEIINLRQIYDARRGVMPVVDPRSFSQWHGLSHQALQKIAGDHGWKGGQLTKEELITWLLENVDNVQEQSLEDTLAIVQFLAEEIESTVQSTLDKKRLEDAISRTEKFVATPKNKLSGPPEAMSLLRDL